MAATVKLPELTSREHALLLSALETYVSGLTVSRGSAMSYAEKDTINKTQAEVKFLIEKVK